MKLIFLGPPGAGKGTQSEYICNDYGIVQLSTGDILRANRKAGTQLGKIAQSYMEVGNLVPDQIIIDMIKNEIVKPEFKNGYILDGFPRTVPQAEALDQLLLSFGDRLNAALVLDVPNHELIRRLSARRTCPNCQKTYHLFYNPPAEDGICDNDSASLYQRDDDKEEAVQNRLRVYENQTQPLIEYYGSKGLAKIINGVGDISDIHDQIKKYLSAV